MNKSLILFILSFSLQIVSFAQTLPEFSKINEIKLLESNREDVRKIFKNYELIKSDDIQHFDHFSTNNAKIEVLYSDGKCSEDFFDFNVPEWKAVSIYLISTNGKIKPSELGLELPKPKNGWSYNHNIVKEDSGIIASSSQEMMDNIYFVPAKKNFSLLCPNKKLPQPSTVLSVLWHLQRQKQFRLIREFAGVNELNLDRYELQKSCVSIEQNTQCPKESEMIKVSVKEFNPNNDLLAFHFVVSGGKVVGKGAEITWDLSGIKPGTYTITAAVDDGCGFCGKTLTKTVTVKDCQNCK